MQEVRFVTRREKVRSFKRQDAFTLRADRGFVWMQRLALFVLKKLGCELVEDRVEVERVVVDGRNFIEQISRQRHELLRHFNKPAVTLLIGAEDYAELMHTATVDMALNFRCSDGWFYERGRFMDLQVQVVPWMRGVLVMP